LWLGENERPVTPQVPAVLHFGGQMHVEIVGYTRVDAEVMFAATGDRWSPESDGASALSEFAGRACYQSWSRPNPATATNAGYLANIIDQQHFSVLEHGSVSMYVTGVSRSLSHELVRHRHFSYSQLSQRYANVDSDVDGQASDGPAFVVPPLFYGDLVAESMLMQQWLGAVDTYRTLVLMAERRLCDAGMTDRHKIRKLSREAARCVLPNMTPTNMVITANHTAWREMLVKRGSLHADAEIRRFAVTVYHKLADIEPNLYADFTTYECGPPLAAPGTEVLVCGV
jgi:thymidylate synthase (FAD)